MKHGIIYKITNRINGKVYIGKTVQPFKERVKAHKYKSCRAFNNAIISHGWDAFDKEEFICALDESYLAGLEEQAIKFHDCLAPKGYNLVEIDNGLNRYSQDTKNKISEARYKYLSNLNEPLIGNQKKHIIIEGVPHKHCYKCDQQKTLDCFGKYKARWDGLVPHCKECQKELQKKYPRKNLTSEQFAQSYKDRKDAVSKALKETYTNNPELRQLVGEKNRKAIIGIHIDSGKQIEYPSALAAKKDGFVNTRIAESIKTGKPHKDYKWRFK